MPTISVIVPVYKVEKYIHRCVDSILNQTFSDFELILVDDGSPDNCGAICDEYAAKDSRVVVIHQENGGLSAARNAGIDWAFANSDSQWLSFIDSDDWVHPEYLQKLLDTAVNNSAEVAFCTLTAFTEDEHGYQEVPFWDKPVCCVRDGISILRDATATRHGRLSGHHVIAWNKIYKKSIFSSIRYPHGQVHEDEAVAHRILGCCNRIAAIDDSLYFYRQHSESIMHTSATLFRELCITLAYGDRILYYQEKNICIADALIFQYWATLVHYFYRIYKEPRCKRLLKKTKQQMRQVQYCYNNSSASLIKKIGVKMFCRLPRTVSFLFKVSVKLRGG